MPRRLIHALSPPPISHRLLGFFSRLSCVNNQQDSIRTLLEFAVLREPQFGRADRQSERPGGSANTRNARMAKPGEKSRRGEYERGRENEIMREGERERVRVRHMRKNATSWCPALLIAGVLQKPLFGSRGISEGPGRDAGHLPAAPAVRAAKIRRQVSDKGPHLHIFRQDRESPRSRSLPNRRSTTCPRTGDAATRCRDMRS